MFCPVCQLEYREGFTECNDCHVHLVASREEARFASELLRKESRLLSQSRLLANRVKATDTSLLWGSLSKGGFWFALHQYIATLGILIFAAYFTAYVFDVLRVFGKPLPQKTMYWILTGTPYFPVQISIGVFLGFVISRRVRHRAMLWVWILPLAYLTYALIAIPTLVPQWIPPAYQAGVGESRFKHYFGWGCGDIHPCFDQDAITVLFYIAAAYSIGALLGRKFPMRPHTSGQREFWVSLITGLIFLSITVLELVLTIEQGWKPIYLGPLATPFGIAMFLILYAFTQRRYPSESNQEQRSP